MAQILTQALKITILRMIIIRVIELWTKNFDALLALVKEYIINLWEVRKVKLYGEPCSTQLQSQSSGGDLKDGTVVEGQRNGKFGKFSHSG